MRIKILETICFVLMAVSLAACEQDQYILSGSFNSVSMKEHDHHIIMDQVQDLVLVSQPHYPKFSYLSDFTATGLILEHDDQSHCYAQSVDNYIHITCYSDVCQKAVDRPTILIDAGHGGKDPGAIAIDGAYEKNITLDFAKRLQRSFLGFPWVDAVLLRDQDVFISKYDRLKTIIQNQPDLLVSIHADAYHYDNASGISAFFIDNSLGSEQSQEIVKSVDQPLISANQTSKRYAQSLLNYLGEQYRLHSKDALPMPLVVLRSPISPSILIELGFLSNPEESTLLQDQRYLDDLANHIAIGLVNQYRIDNKLMEIKHY